MPVTFEGKVISCGRQEGKLFWLPDPPVRVAVLKTEFVDAEVIHFKTVLSCLLYTSTLCCQSTGSEGFFCGKNHS